MDVSFIGGGNRSTRRKPPTCCKSLRNFITCYWYGCTAGVWMTPSHPIHIFQISEICTYLYIFGLCLYTLIKHLGWSVFLMLTLIKFSIIMNRKWRSSISPISTKRTTTLDLKSIDTKKITTFSDGNQFLTWDSNNSLWNKMKVKYNWYFLLTILKRWRWLK